MKTNQLTRIIARAVSEMPMINMHPAKTHFSKLIARVQEGESIIIAKGGKPVAKLVPYKEAE